MSSVRRMHVSAMSKSLNTALLLTEANAARLTETLIVRLGGKSATSWGTVGSTWSLRTLEGVHEEAIRYGAILGCGADRVVRNAKASFAAGENYSGRYRRSLEAGNTLVLAKEAFGLVHSVPFGRA